MDSIDKMIRKLLIERFPYETSGELWGLEQEPSPLSNKEKLFQKIATQQVDKSEVTEIDFDYLINNLEAVDTFMQSQLISLVKDSDAEPDVKEKATAVLQALDDAAEDKLVSRQTFTQPQIRSAPADVGDFPDEVSTILDSLFSPGTGFTDRIKKISEISAFYYELSKDPERMSDEELRAKNNSVFISEIMLLEYLAEIVNSFDSGSGGYLFEYFLALLSGGRVTGKESGPGQGMGAVDFRTADGKAGSSKYYSSKGGIGQAKGGFEVGEAVDYIIAIKKQDATQVGNPSRKGGADPARIMALDIYYLKVERKSKNMFRVENFDGSGSRHKAEGREIALSPFINDASFFSTIYIAETRTKAFREMVYKSVSGTVNAMKEALLKNFESFFVELENAEKNCKQFAASGDLDHGSNTINSLQYAEQSFNRFAEKLTNADTDEVPDFVDLSENKSDFSLDKMIKEVILSTLNK